jgi:hypothetical protein
MNRRTLFLSALLLSGTMAEPKLAAHAKPAVAASAASKGATSVRYKEPHPDAKCGRCTGTGGKDPASVHPAKDNRATSGRDGHTGDVHGRGTDIHHGPEGARQIRVERPDHSILVASHGGHGYIQRSYSYENRLR